MMEKRVQTDQRRTGRLAIWGGMMLWGMLCWAGCSSNVQDPGGRQLGPSSFSSAVEQSQGLQNGQERRRFWLDFLEKNPANEHTFPAIRFLVRQVYLGELSDPSAALDFVREWSPRFAGTAQQRPLEDLLLEALGEAGKKEEIRELRALRGAQGPLAAADLRLFAQAALKAQDWELLEQESERILDIETEDSIRRELGDESSQEDLRAGLQSRRAPALVHLGWALSRQNRLEEALSAFQEADQLAQISLAGFSEWPTDMLDYYFARTLLEAGDPQAAIDRILPLAALGGSKPALELLGEAFRAGSTNGGNFDRFLAESRLRIAPRIPEVSLVDYEGQQHRLGDYLSNALLLVFWFPT